MKIMRPDPQILIQVCLSWDLRICVSGKIHGASGLRSTPREPLIFILQNTSGPLGYMSKAFDWI